MLIDFTRKTLAQFSLFLSAYLLGITSELLYLMIVGYYPSLFEKTFFPLPFLMGIIPIYFMRIKLSKKLLLIGIYLCTTIIPIYLFFLSLRDFV